MTNHWNDIDNTSMILVMGANPSENHPACFAHINAARYGTKNAKLVVVDPRQTRTARQCDPARGDRYIRIRPGTDIAFLNGVMSWILENSLSGSPWNPSSGVLAAERLIDWHNGFAPSTGGTARPNPLSTFSRTFYTDAGPSTTGAGGTVAFSSTNLSGAYYGSSTSGNFVSPTGNTPTALGWPKYCDTKLKVSAAGNDFQRDVLNVAGTKVSNTPIVAQTINDPDCVFQKLRAHTRPYDPATVASICGCTSEELIFVAKLMLENSRFASSEFGVSTAVSGVAQNLATPQNPGYKATTFLYAMGQTQHTYGSQNIKGIAELQTLLGNMGRPGGGINALRGIHNVQGSTDMGVLFDSIPGYSGNPPSGTHDIDHEYIAYVDTLFGARISGYYNRTSLSGGVDCLNNDAVSGGGLGLQQRGFHNMTQEWFGDGKVGAPDMGELYSLWPKGDGVQHIEALRRMSLPSGNSKRIKAAVVWGQNPAVTEPNQEAVRNGLFALDLMVVVDMFETETATVDRKPSGWTYLIPACAHVEEAGSVTNSGRWLQWRERCTPPKGASKTDLELMLRFAKSLSDAGCFDHMKPVWGDISAGLRSPSTTLTSTSDPYTVLYQDKYKWSPTSGVAFENMSATLERWAPGASAPDTAYAAKGSEVIAENVFIELNRPLQDVKNANYQSGGTMWIYSGNSPEAAYCTTLTGPSDANTGGANAADNGGSWVVKNRAKSRNNTHTGAAGDFDAKLYPRWGWAWLLNRRVFYNNNEVKGDRIDNFVSPGYLAYLFTVDTNDYADFAGNALYRKFKKFKDVPSTVAYAANGLDPVDATTPHWLHALNGDGSLGAIARNAGGKAVSLAGRFSAHTEPIESPNVDASGMIFTSATQAVSTLQSRWGVNTSYGADLHFGNSATYATTPIGSPKDFPLVLTTIRCVEHFQGGPITRNNPANVETEPEPWIEINPVDARAAGIVNGDWVNVVTARSNSCGPTATAPGRLDNQGDRCADGAMAPSVPAPDAAHDGGLVFTSFAKGFRARVDNSIAGFQRVAPGVVAIPWHWGDRGLSTGSRANDLCIDAWDANTMIPEYKACLCRIEKA